MNRKHEMSEKKKRKKKKQASEISIYLKFLHRQTINTSANTVQVEHTNLWFN